VVNKSSFADQELSPKALEQLLTTLSQVRAGNFNVRMTAEGDGMEHEVGDAVNELVATLASLTTELERVSEAVTQGEMRARLPLDRANGAWGQQLRAVNNIVVVFGKHLAELRRTTKALHAGDLSRPVNVGPDATHKGGELQRAAEDLNAMMGHVQQVTSEIARVFAEIGLDGRFNTQCHIGDASGCWGLLVGSVNAASASLAEQVQDLCAMANALCSGNLAARATVTSRGDLQLLKNGLNGSAESLAALCDELRRVAQEVAVEGKLSVELRHPNPQGQWQSAQDGVNRMLHKLAQASRQLAEHAEQVLQGEYEASESAAVGGELGAPARMLQALAEQQAYTQTALAALIDGRFEAVPLRGETQRDLALAQLSLRLKREYFRSIRGSLLEAREHSIEPAAFVDAALAAVANASGAAAGAYYMVQDGMLVRCANLGCEPANDQVPVRVGEGLTGKVALSGEPILLDDLDQRGVRVRSGLLELTPRALLLFPITRDEHVIGVMELLFLNTAAVTARELLEYLCSDIARGPRVVDPSTEAARVQALEEELVIANTRLERMASELALRERPPRAAGGGAG
jgi:methyl-accepting chemotaxis protein